jgi:hypothetical protein
MDHPSSDWKDKKKVNDVFYLTASKAKLSVRNRHFRFNPLVDETDHVQCFLWELFRTEIFLKIRNTSGATSFPFNVLGFPEKPYLSFNKDIRVQWRESWKYLGASQRERKRFFNLLQPHLGSTEEIEIGRTDNVIMECHTPTLKIPIELHVHPNWNAQKLTKLFCEQVDEIISAVKENQKAYEAQGYKILSVFDKQPIRNIQRKLKLLGHFRLKYCVDLNLPAWQRGYSGTGDDYYRDEATLKRDLRKEFPQFKTFIN